MKVGVFKRWIDRIEQTPVIDNTGEVSMTDEGELAIGIGDGLVLDIDGNLGYQVAPGWSISLEDNNE